MIRASPCTSATDQVPTLDAQHTVIAMYIAQVQPLGNVVGIGGADPAAQEQHHAGHETGDGCVVPRFGVRGIGSVYYLCYAINHGLPAGLARELSHITIVVVMVSIVAHGISVTPLLNRYWKD